MVTNFLWYYNYGSHGPAPYIFVIIYSFFIFVFTKNEAVILSIIAAINLVVLFILEYENPGIVGHYATDKDRVLDVFSALVYYGLVFYVFLSIVREAYYSEYKKAKEADRLKTSFLANMSHEIRTPLNAIVGFSNLLGDNDLKPEDRKQYISIINASNKSLLRLVDDILDVSLIETNQLKLVYKNCDLQKMMFELEETYQMIIKEKGLSSINIIDASPEKRLFVRTDSDRLRQVMINLLDNAIKYTEGGTVTFGFGVEKEYLRFYVRDTGIGVGEKHLGYLFDRFYKIEDKHDRLFRGTGIGLFLCKKIVELLGGEIGVNSALNKGSEFYFTLPKTDVKEVKDEFVNSSINKVQRSGSHFKVLVVEDQVSNQQYYKAILKAPVFDTMYAINGLDGLDKFRAHRDTQLILMDIKMPVMDGFEALKEIRKLDEHVPVFAITAHALGSDRKRCLEAGFNAYFPKPMNKDMLLKEILIQLESKR